MVAKRLKEGDRIKHARRDTKAVFIKPHASSKGHAVVLTQSGMRVTWNWDNVVLVKPKLEWV